MRLGWVNKHSHQTPSNLFPIRGISSGLLSHFNLPARFSIRNKINLVLSHSAHRYEMRKPSFSQNPGTVLHSAGRFFRTGDPSFSFDVLWKWKTGGEAIHPGLLRLWSVKSPGQPHWIPAKPFSADLCGGEAASVPVAVAQDVKWCAELYSIPGPSGTKKLGYIDNPVTNGIFI